MKFSLLTLIGVTSLAGLACAALAKPSGEWLTVVVTLTALAFGWQMLRVLLLTGAPRAAATGWLLFATAYLAMVFGPLVGERLGPLLLTSRTIHAAQQRWFPEPDSSAGQLLLNFVPTGNALLTGRPGVSQITVSVDPNANFSLLSNYVAALGALNTTTPQTGAFTPALLFHLTGHWLCAWLAGALGAAAATALHRRASA